MIFTHKHFPKIFTKHCKFLKAETKEACFLFILLFCFVLNAIKVTGTVSSVGKMLGAKEAWGSGLIPNTYAQLWLISTALERQPASPPPKKLSELKANETEYIKKGRVTKPV